MPSSETLRSNADQRAIVWMPVGTVAPPPLLDSLKKRGVQLTLVHSELVALAHACANHHNEAVGGGTLVILCEAEKLPKVAHAVVAMRRYAASAVVYVYEPRAKVSLREVSNQDLVDWGATNVKTIHHEPGAALIREPMASIAPAPRPSPMPSIPSAPPTLRLTQPLMQQTPTNTAPNMPITSAGPIVRDDAPPSDVLSADELEMLLGRNGKGGRS